VVEGRVTYSKIFGASLALSNIFYTRWRFPYVGRQYSKSGVWFYYSWRLRAIRWISGGAGIFAGTIVGTTMPHQLADLVALKHIW